MPGMHAQEWQDDNPVPSLQGGQNAPSAGSQSPSRTQLQLSTEARSPKMSPVPLQAANLHPLAFLGSDSLLSQTLILVTLKVRKPPLAFEHIVVAEP